MICIYINEVLRRVRSYLPSEYGTGELYTWCNEVSAMLAVDDRIVYREIRPPLADDGTILLPDGVRMENVVRIFDGARELKLRPHRPPKAGRKAARGDVTVIYEEPYRPIRLVKYSGAATVDAARDRLYIHDCEFISGDTLSLTAGGVTYPGIPLISVEYDPDDPRGYILTVGEGALSGITGTDYENAEISRAVTDKTVCDAPYDMMYVDYLLAKIAQYQRDAAAYTASIAAFNSALSQYKSWLTARMPHRSDNFKNYW